MLYIIGRKKFLGSVPDGNVFSKEWHINEPVPNIGQNRIITFQADGHELELILNALAERVVL